ncbi:hypothetical protein PBOR_34405 [Paenibacillus borealis]|uniref:Uncharacterized protein n=1 Tax=Paenibacillus borealis TaxID=160799 RepID=A0A089LKP1_PAEBO|nr:hypothetical protein PBOR_34405 [Paenibacillus borealis]
MDKLMEVLEAKNAVYVIIHHERQIRTAQEGAEFFGIEPGQTAQACRRPHSSLIRMTWRS